MGRLEGKVAFITGAARGQGRSHAVRLAQEGADIIAVDVCAPIDSFPYPMASPEDLAETARQVETLGRRIVARQADVRDLASLNAAVADGVEMLGRLDILAANAGGYHGPGPAAAISEDAWQDTLDVCLRGTWNSYRAALAPIRAGGRGGSIVFTSSVVGINGAPYLAEYVAAKTAVIGLMKSVSLEHARESIRVNVVAPGNVDTAMLRADVLVRAMRPDLESPTFEDVRERFLEMSALPIPWAEPVDVSNAVLFLASDEARYITGQVLAINSAHS